MEGVPPEDVPGVDVTGDEILETFGFNTDKLARDVMMLLLNCVFYLSLTFLLLKYRRGA